MASRVTPRTGPSRRSFLLGGAAGAAVGAVAGGAATAAGMPDAASDSTGDLGTARIPFHGPHQAGVASAPAAHVTMLAYDLVDGATREDLRRLMRLWTDDARRLTAGLAPLADSEPELAAKPSRLTVTIGWGAAAAALAGGDSAVPSWLRPLPPFSIDALEERWCDGDLLLMVAADDPLAVSHACRMLGKDAARFTVERWRQQGFRHAAGTRPEGTTMRNLFGQLDGTESPAIGSAERATRAFIEDGWLAGGTSLVLRRIRMDLDTWDEVDRPGRENAVGRTLDTGAPLTGGAEHDDVDLEAVDARGFPIISDVAHVRRARPDDEHQRIVRLGWNYDDAPESGEASNAGLLFVSLQRDVEAQYLPIQERLAQADLLNTWTTPIGSAVFAILPGCGEDGYLGETLLG